MGTAYCYRGKKKLKNKNRLLLATTIIITLFIGLVHGQDTSGTPPAGDSGGDDLQPAPSPEPPADQQPPPETPPEGGGQPMGAGPSYTPVSFQAIQPQTSIRADGYYETGLFTGAATYTYDVPVMPGTNGLAPSLTLQYNSQNAQANSWIGNGWRFTGNYIEKDVNGTMDNGADDEYGLYLNGARYDLKHVAADGRYHTQPESYLYIEKKTGALNENGTYWLVRDKGGVKYRFGYVANSELTRRVPQKPTQYTADQHVFVNWGSGSGGCKKQVFDAGAGNWIVYVSIDNTNCNAHSCDHTYHVLSQNQVEMVVCAYAEYGGEYCGAAPCSASADFHFRYNVPNNGTTPFVVRWSLDDVEDTHGNSVYYTYAENPGADDRGTSYLSKIEYNNDRKRAIEFTLEDNPNSRLTYEDGAEVRMSKRLKEMTEKYDGSLVRKVNFGYAQNDMKTITLLSNIEVCGSDGTTCLPKTSFAYNPAVPGWNSGYNQLPCAFGDADGCRFGNLNGDSLADVIQSNSVLKKSWLNNGAGWTEDNRWAPPSNVILTGDTGWGLLDVNGDGKDDIHSFTGTYLNTGSGWVWNTQWGNVCDFASATQCRFIDLNSDSLIDVVRTNGDDHQAWMNTGKNFTRDDSWAPNVGVNFDTSETWGVIDLNGDGNNDILGTEKIMNTGLSLVWLGQTTQWQNPCTFKAADKCRYVDLNSDGLVDVLQAAGATNHTWINNGTGWVQNDSWIAAGVDIGLSGNVIDLNGDGLPDVRRDLLKYGVAPYSLREVISGFGGNTTINYKAAEKFNMQTVEDKLSYPVWCVESVKEDNRMGGAHQTSNTIGYYYEGALHDYEDREYRGFNVAVVTRPDGGRTTTRFHQDDARKGMAYEEYDADQLDVKYSQTKNTISGGSVNGIYNPLLTRTEEYTHDGLDNPRITAAEYGYDQYENTINTSYLGDTSVSGDERYAYSEYLYNTGSWIVDRPKHAYLVNATGGKVSESFLSYDGQGYGSPPTKGDLTRKEDWLSTGGNPISTFEYDGYGNQVKATDPLNHNTRQVYGITDTTYTYPEQTINHLLHTTNVRYDFGTGNILSVTDPNGYVTAYKYDQLGRKTKEIRPYDSDASPTTQYLYVVDGTAPESVKVIKKTDTTPLNFLEYYDGLGRVVQSKRDAEDPLKQIVTNVYYNNIGGVREQSIPYLGDKTDAYSTPQAVLSTKIGYDIVGRVANVTNTDGTVKKQAFDRWTVSAWDEKGNRKDYVLDGYGMVAQVREYNGGDVYATSYGYDAQDNLVEIMDNHGNQFKFTYDSLGRKIGMDDPDLGVWTYEYDSAGNLLRQTDNKGTQITFEYDELNRVRRRLSPDQTVTYQYDAIKGTLSSVQDQLGTTSYDYDQKLRKTSETKAMDSRVWTTAWTFDPADRVKTETTPGFPTLTYNYNTQGEVNSITNAVENIDYNALNKITLKDWGQTETQLTYDPATFRLNRISSAGIQDLNYQYDPAGNVLNIDDKTTQSNQHFTYDGLNRLLTAEEDGGYWENYTYNSLGNILNVEADTGTTAYAYGTKPHAVTGLTKPIPPLGYVWQPDTVMGPPFNYTTGPSIWLNTSNTEVCSRYVAHKTGYLSGGYGYMSPAGCNVSIGVKNLYGSDYKAYGVLSKSSFVDFNSTYHVSKDDKFWLCLSGRNECVGGANGSYARLFSATKLAALPDYKYDPKLMSAYRTHSSTSFTNNSEMMLGSTFVYYNSTNKTRWDYIGQTSYSLSWPANGYRTQVMNILNGSTVNVTGLNYFVQRNNASAVFELNISIQNSTGGIVYSFIAPNTTIAGNSSAQWYHQELPSLVFRPYRNYVVAYNVTWSPGNSGVRLYSYLQGSSSLYNLTLGSNSIAGAKAYDFPYMTASSGDDAVFYLNISALRLTSTGGACIQNDDCISGYCINNICSDTPPAVPPTILTFTMNQTTAVQGSKLLATAGIQNGTNPLGRWLFLYNSTIGNISTAVNGTNKLLWQTNNLTGNYSLTAYVNDTAGMNGTMGGIWVNIYTTSTTLPPKIVTFTVNESNALQGSALLVSTGLQNGTNPLGSWWFHYNGTLGNVSSAVNGTNTLLWGTSNLAGNYSLIAYVNDTTGDNNTKTGVWVNIYTTTTTLPPAILTFAVNQTDALQGSTLLTSAAIKNGTKSLDSWWFQYNSTLGNMSTAVNGTNTLLWQTSNLTGNFSLTAYVNDTSGNNNTKGGVWVNIYAT
ncbi:MAG: toxin TcdB middle/N-terminal domain-containing protein, partial [Candidatus Altiarchaeota archaeon]